MKKQFIFYSAILLISFSSCRNTKEIALFQDVKTDISTYNLPEVSAEYKIKSFDNLYISVLTLDPDVNKLFNPSLAGEGSFAGTQQMYGTPAAQYINGYRVSSEGDVDLPIIGKIILSGLSLKEAQEKLENKALEYLNEPEIQVKLLNFRVNISGEVRNPGLFYNYEGRINILDAISMASGVTEHADLRNVYVTQYTKGKAKTYKVDITQHDVFYSDIFFLKNNDLVYIPPNKLKRRSENASTYSLILSTISTILVAVALIVN